MLHLHYFSLACCCLSDIEDLTRKTGNFKQFPIFCSMLESAVSKVTRLGPTWAVCLSVCLCFFNSMDSLFSRLYSMTLF